MIVERHPGSVSGLSDDQLATVAVSLAVGELQWSPDVAPATLDRISRDAVAYPEQFDRRAAPQAPQGPPPPSERSAKRAVGRLAVFGVILVAIIGVVAFAATASASAADPHGLRLQLEETTAGFDQPLLVTNAGDGSGMTCCSSTWWGADVDELVTGAAAAVPIGAIDGTLVSFGVDERGELYAVDQGGRILHVVTEAS